MAYFSIWLDENKLSLHLGKTESIQYASKKRVGNINKMSVTCDDVNFSSESNIKYLGVTVDQDMAGTSMGTSVVNTMNAKITFLYRKRHVLDSQKERCCLCLYFNQVSTRPAIHGIKGNKNV